MLVVRSEIECPRPDEGSVVTIGAFDGLQPISSFGAPCVLQRIGFLRNLLELLVRSSDPCGEITEFTRKRGQFAFEVRHLRA